MRVTLVTTWDTACGIAEYAAYLKQAIEEADPGIQIEVETNLHPDAVDHFLHPRALPDWIWLNYHAALHSQWTPESVRRVQSWGVRVCIIYHDTGVPNSAQCTALHAVADLFIIHEPAEDLPGAIYLRQGVPAAPGGHQPYFPSVLKFRAYHGQPTVGSLGFPFPWKNYDLLAEASFLAGWALILLAPNATPEQIAGWRSRNPHSFIESGFTERREAVATLAACDATAFLYANANTGTSAAIRQGIAARKPVIATSAGGCRQFRDLYLDPVGREAIMWMSSLTVEGVAANLMAVTPAPFDAPTVRLAHQDRWALRGQQIAALLRGTGWETLR